MIFCSYEEEKETDKWHKLLFSVTRNVRTHTHFVTVTGPRLQTQSSLELHWRTRNTMSINMMRGDNGNLLIKEIESVYSLILINHSAWARLSKQWR